MSTPLADRIREQAQKAAAAPTTGGGAGAALTKQAVVSQTGKAATPSTGAAQSSIAENIAARGTQTAQDAAADQVQQAGEATALTEQKAAVDQSAKLSSRKMRKLEADNQFNNTLSKFTSRISMAEDKQEADLASLELKTQLSAQRINNKKYMDTVRDIGRRKRLSSKEDFQREASELALGRSKESLDSVMAREAVKNDAVREGTLTNKMNEVQAALDKQASDIQRAKDKTLIEGATAAAKVGMDVYAASEAEEAKNVELSKVKTSADKGVYETRHGVGSYNKDRAQIEKDLLSGDMDESEYKKRGFSRYKSGPLPEQG